MYSEKTIADSVCVLMAAFCIKSTYFKNSNANTQWNVSSFQKSTKMFAHELLEANEVVANMLTETSDPRQATVSLHFTENYLTM